jgi:hypothetical protein
MSAGWRVDVQASGTRSFDRNAEAHYRGIKGCDIIYSKSYAIAHASACLDRCLEPKHPVWKCDWNCICGPSALVLTRDPISREAFDRTHGNSDGSQRAGPELEFILGKQMRVAAEGEYPKTSHTTDAAVTAKSGQATVGQRSVTKEWTSRSSPTASATNTHSIGAAVL